MEQYAGKCFKGPYDGKEYVHHSKSFEVMEPVIKGADIFRRDPHELKITSQAMGHYEYLATGTWHWIPR